MRSGKGANINRPLYSSEAYESLQGESPIAQLTLRRGEGGSTTGVFAISAARLPASKNLGLASVAFPHLILVSVLPSDLRL